MAESLKSKSILIYDYGTFLSMAERLAKDYGKVYYYCPWKSSFPQVKLMAMGEGIKGVERVASFFDHVDDADVIYFTDVIDGDIQVHLDSLGKKVFGSRKGEDLELNREGLKNLLKELKLPTGKYEIVKGITNLRKYLKSHDNIWVKISTYRGDFETFKSVNYAYIETRLQEVENNLGIMKESVDFLCENDLPNKVEIGYDGYCIDGIFPTKSLCGIEVKDVAYIGIFKDYKLLPKPVLTVNEKLSPILNKYGYKNFFSTEIRVGKDGLPYLIDPCCRSGSPPSEIYQMLYTNIADIIWNGANGKCIDPIPSGKYAVEVMIHCNWAERNWLPVLRPEKYRDNIKFRNMTVLDGINYIVPQYVGLPEIGSIVMTGKSIDECIGKIEEIAETIKGFYIELPLHSIDTVKEEIKTLKSFGYNLFE
jgi:hypothetical protein